MPNIFFKIDPSLLPILIEYIYFVSCQFEENLAIDIQFPDNDPELSESWKQSLLADLQYDSQNLLSLMSDESFGQTPVTLEISFAEAISRACSAIRHKLRYDFLKKINDNDLESGDMDLTKLPNDLIKPYTCFVFLASLQEAVVESIEAELDFSK